MSLSPPPVLFFDVLGSPILVFLVGLILLALSVLIWLKFAPHTRFANIEPIVTSWLGMLLVLWLAFFLSLYFDNAIALVLIGFGIVTKGLQEILQLWQAQKPKRPTAKIAPFFWLDGVLLGFLLLFCLAWQQLTEILSVSHELGILLFVVFAVQFNDVGQYIMGKWLGQRLFARKLAPTISPNKTLEGAIFGTLLTAVICLLVGRLLTPFSLWQSFTLTVMLGITGIVGDLLQSAVKRQHGIKDMGAWLKGHGGIMDRMDSLLISLPLFWLIYVLCLS